MICPHAIPSHNVCDSVTSAPPASLCCTNNAVRERLPMNNTDSPLTTALAETLVSIGPLVVNHFSFPVCGAMASSFLGTANTMAADGPSPTGTGVSQAFLIPSNFPMTSPDSGFSPNIASASSLALTISTPSQRTKLAALMEWSHPNSLKKSASFAINPAMSES